MTLTWQASRAPPSRQHPPTAARDVMLLSAPPLGSIVTARLDRIHASPSFALPRLYCTVCLVCLSVWCQSVLSCLTSLCPAVSSVLSVLCVSILSIFSHPVHSRLPYIPVHCVCLFLACPFSLLLSINFVCLNLYLSFFFCLSVYFFSHLSLPCLATPVCHVCPFNFYPV